MCDAVYVFKAEQDGEDVYVIEKIHLPKASHGIPLNKTLAIHSTKQRNKNFLNHLSLR